MAGKKASKKGKAQKRTTTSTGGKQKQEIFSLERLSGRVQIGVVALILILAIFLLYPELVFQNKIFMARDVEAATSFARAAHRVMIDENVYPLWNPYLFSGMPSYESLAYNPYVYPLSFLTGFLITKLHFPPYTWLLFHTLLLGFGVFLLLRDRGIPWIPSAMAGVLMIWMPNVVAIGANGHGSQACAIAYMPFVLLFWDRLSRGKGIFINGSALAIILGFQMLRAHIQISYYTYAIIGMHLIFFTVARFVDAAKGKPVKESPLPVHFFQKLRSAKGTSNFRLAVFETGLLAVVLLIIVASSLSISSVLYLPVHEYAQYSIRGASEGGLDYDYATSWSLHPLESLTFILPFSFGFGKDIYYGYMPFTDYPNYLGLVLLLGALTAVFIARTRFTEFLVFLAVVATIVAFGKYFPLLYDPLFKWFPFFNKFRVPVMVLVVQQLAAVLLFAAGFSAFLDRGKGRGGKIAVRGVVVFLVVLVLAVISQGYWKEGFARSIAGRLTAGSSAQEQLQLARYAGNLLLQDLIKFAILGSAVFIFILLYCKRLIARGILILFVCAVAMFDAYMVNRYIIHPERFLKSNKVRLIQDAAVIDRFLEPDPVVDFLKSDKSFFRIMPFFHPSAPFIGDFVSNRFMTFGISSIGGYHAAKLAPYNELLKSLSPALASGNYQILNMLNVRYLVAAYPLPDIDIFNLVWSGVNWKGQKRFIYENLEALPRVFFVDTYSIAAGDKALQILQSAGLDPSKRALLEHKPAVEPVSREGSEASISRFSFNEIHVDAKVASPCIMVLSEIFYPRWKVSVDGNPAELLRANYVLRAVSLPAGNHQVVFKYDAGLIKRSFHISLITFSLLFSTLIISVILRSRYRWKLSL